MKLGLDGRIALVTGSHRGTGWVIAERLAEEGAIVLAHRPEPWGEQALPKGAAGGTWGELRSDAGAEQVCRQALAHAGRVDVLINNFGAADEHAWFAANATDWVDAYQTNVLSAQRMITGLAPTMQRNGWGRIIQLGTVGSTQPNARRPAYYAAKSALVSLTVSLAQTLGGHGITVNVVSPGYIRTPEIEAAFRAKAQREGWGDDWSDIERRIVARRFPNPIGRIARREEVADLVCFVASERAAFVNGQNLRIDGGALALVT